MKYEKEIGNDRLCMLLTSIEAPILLSISTGAQPPSKPINDKGKEIGGRGERLCGCGEAVGDVKPRRQETQERSLIIVQERPSLY